MHKIDIQYFEQIYYQHLISIAGCITWLVALLSYLNYGSHHHHMQTDQERLGLQNHCLVKYVWECYFPQGHIDRFDSPQVFKLYNVR